MFRPYQKINRRKTRVINVGDVLVGGNNPISVQTMTNTLTTDVESTSKQINRAVSAGVDLVREQLRIAAGKPMSCGKLMMRGHAIEVRLYAEDASNNFLPAIGPLAVFRPPTGPGIRLDTGVREGDMVTPNYDPMLAKLIVWAPSRPEALQRMRRALDEFVVLGTTTNLRFLRELCDHEDVVSGNTDTTMIERAWPDGWSPQLSSDILNGALMVAGVSESAGLHQVHSTITSADDGPQSLSLIHISEPTRPY